MSPAPVPRAPSRRRTALSLTGAGVCGIALLAAGMAGAQDAPNPALTFSFGSTFTANDNLDLDPVSAGTSSWIDNRFGLSYATETATSALAFDASGVWRLSDIPGAGGGSDFDDQTAALSYSREGANSRLTLNGRINRSDIAFFDPLRLVDDPSTPIDEGDLTAGDDGSRRTTSASLRFETGIAGPLGFDIAASHYGRDYQDTTDPDYYDTTRDTLSLGATLRPNERLSLRLSLSQTDYSAKDAPQTERSTRRASVGGSYALDPATSLSFSVGKTWIDSEEGLGLGRVSSSEDGLNASLGLSRALANGSIGLSLSHDITVDGEAWTDLLLSRDMELPNGALSVSLGPSFRDGETGVVGTLAFDRELPRGAFSLSASRKISSSDDSTRDTMRLGLGLSHALTPLSSLSLDIDYLDTDSDRAGADRSRSRLSLTYSHDLGQDWQLRGGYALTESDREGEATARSNSVFLTLQKAITFSP